MTRDSLRPPDPKPNARPVPRFGTFMLVVLLSLVAVGLFEASRRSRLADWHAAQANACAIAAAEFEERAESLHADGREADAESCLRSATILAHEQAGHERMSSRLRWPFW